MRNICFYILAYICLFVDYEAKAQSLNDYVKLVRSYADEMIINGCDHYGEVFSPLFSTALRRDTTNLLPYPQFQRREQGFSPGNHWSFESYFLNIPMLGSSKNGSGNNGEHGMEKPHKQTISGDDPLDNLGVYKTLYALTDLTGDYKYKSDAMESLKWFYLHTQGPSGLYPWGEHLGWDFRYDYVTYHMKGYENFIINPYRGEIREPITELYQSWEHEPRGSYTEWEPFLKILSELPTRENEYYKPIEKYALGIWEEHFFDKEKGYYNRHGDYFGMKRGIDGAYSGNMMFAKYSGYFIMTWAWALISSNNNEFKEQVVKYMHKLIKANWKLHKEFGYRPALLDRHEYDSRQCLQMAFQMIKAGQMINTQYPELAKEAINYGYMEIEYFCEYVAGDISKYKSKDPETIYYAYVVSKDVRLIELFQKLVESIIENRDKLIRYNADQAAKVIECLLNAYELLEHKSYIKECTDCANAAIKLYMTSDSPLPKCVPADTLITVDGCKWKTFYYSHLGSDDLMAAIAHLALVLTNIKN
mgnify:FL=1